MRKMTSKLVFIFSRAIPLYCHFRRFGMGKISIKNPITFDRLYCYTLLMNRVESE